MFGNNIGRLTQAQYRRYFSSNDDARQAFLARKEQGLNLSERVWRYANDFRKDIELGLDVGIRSGLDADAMSRELRTFLQQPERLFRRVRDEHGNPFSRSALPSIIPDKACTVPRIRTRAASL